MSSLWTPGGEHPVDRNREAAGADRAADPAREAPTGPASSAEPAPGAAPSEEELRQRAAELQRYLLQARATDVVAQHAMGLYELAAIHLSQEDPRLDDARLAIDAFAALVEGLEGRLGDAEAQLREVLPQLRMAYVQVADRATSTTETDESSTLRPEQG